MGKKQRIPLRQEASSTTVTSVHPSSLLAKKRKGRSHLLKKADGNPYREEVESLKEEAKFWKEDLFLEDIEEHSRKDKAWRLIEKDSQRLCDKYAWAIPDERSLAIIAEFSPLVEIGAGRGYWSRLLQERGVDIIPYDKYVSDDISAMWTEVQQGDPTALSDISLKTRNLFLCYPDEQESMASVCLENFQGEYIIHVGETIFTGTLFSPPVAPFGRTSSADFQVSLAESFHCVLVAELKLTYPISKDCISVWKRTQFIRGVAGDNTSDHRVISASSPSTLISSSSAKLKQRQNEDTDIKLLKKKKKKKIARADAPRTEDTIEFVDVDYLAKLREAALDLQYHEEEESRWANIPVDELLPIDRAASKFAHLL